MQKYISYLRVSTDSQGVVGLGMAAQEDLIAEYIKKEDGDLLQEFREVESGKNNYRPQLIAALRACRQTKSTLLIAKIDRLSRNKAFIDTLSENKDVSFVACDQPKINDLTLSFLVFFAELEGKMISERTKAALDAKKARGEVINRKNNLTPASIARGQKKGLEVRKQKALAFAEDFPQVLELRESGKTLQEIADYLNLNRMETRRGMKWNPAAVARVVKRLQPPE
jgi:DNA invertase Pin-like site-specific DNA recombinase